MNRNKRKALLFLVCSLLAAAVFTWIVTSVDVKPVGVENSLLGLSTINKTVFNTLGVHMVWYEITEALGQLTVLTALVFFMAGAYQLIKKGPGGVDRIIINLGIVYFITVVLYIAFNFIVINYRPIILPDEVVPESSYPSSHTMLACVVWGTSYQIWNKMQIFHKIPGLKTALTVISTIMLILIPLGRLYSGGHYLSDILGGILFSMIMIALFTLLNTIRKV